jgi:hypothetical protein
VLVPAVVALLLSGLLAAASQGRSDFMLSGGAGGVVEDVNVTLNDLTMARPDAVDIALVGPNGALVILVRSLCRFTDPNGGPLPLPVNDLGVNSTTRRLPLSLRSGLPVRTVRTSRETAPPAMELVDVWDVRKHWDRSERL